MSPETPDDLHGRFFYCVPDPADASATQEIVVGIYPPAPEAGDAADDSTDDAPDARPAHAAGAEFVVRWFPAPRGPRDGHPRIDAFSDSWAALRDNPDVLRALASLPLRHPSPEEVALALEEIGFRRLDLLDR